MKEKGKTSVNLYEYLEGKYLKITPHAKALTAILVSILIVIGIAQLFITDWYNDTNNRNNIIANAHGIVLQSIILSFLFVLYDKKQNNIRLRSLRLLLRSSLLSALHDFLTSVPGYIVADKVYVYFGEKREISRVFNICDFLEGVENNTIMYSCLGKTSEPEKLRESLDSLQNRLAAIITRHQSYLYPEVSSKLLQLEYQVNRTLENWPTLSIEASNADSISEVMSSVYKHITGVVAETISMKNDIEKEADFILSRNDERIKIEQMSLSIQKARHNIRP